MIFHNVEFSHINHVATSASAKLNDENPLEMLDTIIDGTKRTLDFAVKFGAGKLLLTSSGAVYGKQPPDMTHISEDYMGGPDTMNPSSAYSEGKRVSELLCAIYSKKYGIECKIARCFAFVGPYFPLDIHYAIGNFIRDALNGGPIVVKGDGTPVRSYLYGTDLAVWLWSILFKGTSSRVYNVGSSHGGQLSDVALTVSSATPEARGIDVLGSMSSNAIVDLYVPLTQRASNELGLEKYVKLESAILKTLSWFAKTDHGEIM